VTATDDIAIINCVGTIIFGIIILIKWRPGTPIPPIPPLAAREPPKELAGQQYLLLIPAPNQPPKGSQ
jgi:hypothetical protein